MATVLVILSFTGKTPLPDGDFHREDACAGADLRLSCGTAESIIVQDVQFGTKPTQICSQSDTSAGCCSYAETDCFLPFDSNVIGESCSGRILCNPGQIAATDSSSCNHDTASQYPGVSHYLTTEVKCVPGKLLGTTTWHVRPALHYVNCSFPMIPLYTEQKRKFTPFR